MRQIARDPFARTTLFHEVVRAGTFGKPTNACRKEAQSCKPS